MKNTRVSYPSPLSVPPQLISRHAPLHRLVLPPLLSFPLLWPLFCQTFHRPWGNWAHGQLSGVLDFWHSVQPLNSSSPGTLPRQALSCSRTMLETVLPFCFLSGLVTFGAQRRRSLAIRQANNIHGCGSMIRASSRRMALNKCFSCIMLIFQQGSSLRALSVKLGWSSSEVCVAPAGCTARHHQPAGPFEQFLSRVGCHPRPIKDLP